MDKVIDNNLVTLLVSLTILFFALGVAISVFVALYYKKRNTFLREKSILKAQYEKSILQSQLEIKEHTLNHVSQEIHDNVGQSLSVTKMQLNILEQSEAVYQPALRAAKDSLGKAMKDLRDIAKGLSTDRVEHFSLVENTREELERIRNAHITDVECTANGAELPLDEERKLIVFRMIQECIQNILKHAGASHIAVTFTYNSGSLHIGIRDNGAGFNVEEAIRKSRGLGLHNIIKRSAILGGQTEISSTLNTGTTVNITIPYA